MRRFLRNQQGLTIVEIMIAVGILGVGLVALSSAIPLASYGIHEGSHLSTATFLANQRLEQVRNARWEVQPPPAPDLDNLGVSASAMVAPANFADESMAEPYLGYSRTVRITDCGVGAGCNGIVNADLRQVVVTVTYRPMTGIGVSAAGTAKPATVTMYITKR